jgi:hypothetical protein
MWATSVIFFKLPAVNNRPIGENSPNLVTLVLSGFCQEVDNNSQFISQSLLPQTQCCQIFFAKHTKKINNPLFIECQALIKMPFSDLALYQKYAIMPFQRFH